jgi:hypothetical protein
VSAAIHHLLLYAFIAHGSYQVLGTKSDTLLSIANYTVKLKKG